MAVFPIVTQLPGEVIPGFVVLNRNLLDTPVNDIDQTEVLGTVFNGELVYDATGALR